ncbi:MAG: thiol peroxidase [Aerococcus viridans]|nr:MAG: thiol peroxidase [Aerococcus viridans]
MEIKRGDQVIHLVGQQLAVGDQLPDVNLIDKDKTSVALADHINGLTVISIVPDINTRTCNIQTNRFAALAKEKEYPILTISTNSPDDIVNWCHANDVDMVYLSDENHDLADASGLLMAENDKLARTVFLVDATGKIEYMEIVPDMREEPNYDAVIALADSLSK